MSNGAPIRVVIIGGGAAGVATAFWLTAPEQNNRYHVTLYTQGWRLGGKCASGRNHSTADRIEEHGLHMLMGCYQNAFATLRACYEAWTPPPQSPISTWTDAFLPQRQLTLMERDGRGGGWAPWDFGDLPQLPGQPGDGFGELATAAGIEKKKDEMHRLVLKLADWLEQSIGAQRLVEGGAAAIHALRAPLVHQTDDLKRRLAVLQTANEQLSAAIGGKTKRRRYDLPLAAADSTRLDILANLGVAMGFGYFRDIVFQGEDGYDKLNALDFRAWLSTCGAVSQTLAAAPIRALYDLAFAFPGGVANNINLGSLAAGVTYRFAMELAFGYRDAPLWKMAAGMGDIVFAPFYQVLEARQPGCVKFFSRLADMSAQADGRIQSVDISIQAVTADSTPYKPLASVEGLACWPNEPDWDQLQNGSVLHGANVNFESSFCTVSAGSKTLTVDQDFDLVILAIPPAAILKTPATFAQGEATWQAALRGSSSVATQSLQLWVNKTVANLGWTLGPTVLTAFAEDYDSWGDMSHLLPMETWSGANAPQAIGYFVGCLPVPQQPPPTPSSMLQAATQLADQWIAQSLSALWPNYPQSQAVSRYDVANFDSSDLYVLTPSGTNVSSRFSSAVTAGFSNLYVVGDWTRTRFSGGCFESAVESAMLASQAISGIPAQIKTT